MLQFKKVKLTLIADMSSRLRYNGINECFYVKLTAVIKADQTIACTCEFCNTSFAYVVRNNVGMRPTKTIFSQKSQ